MVVGLFKANECPWNVEVLQNSMYPKLFSDAFFLAKLHFIFLLRTDLM